MDRRESGYYSTPPFIAKFIADTIAALSPDAATVFDPCIGSGELTAAFDSYGLKISGVDILDHGVPAGIEFTQGDFLALYRDRKDPALFSEPTAWPYDVIVANPPYNCHEVSYIRDNRAWLEPLFPDIGTHNMYSMFMEAIIDAARPNALIGVITLDSFLTARLHRALRESILRKCAIHYLLLCPNDLFRDQGADVRTCILILQKGTSNQGHVKVLNRPPSEESFRETLLRRAFSEAPLSDLVLSSEIDASEFIVGVPHDIKVLFANPRLAQFFPCVTGISTGNDARYLSAASRPGFTIPFYKNPGSKKFHAEPNAFLADDFLDLAGVIPNFMVRNQHLLYKSGITCSSMGVPFSACYLPPNSTYGVNANIIVEEPDIWWLLAYLNSTVVTYLVRNVLNRSNMITSGYVSRIPLPSFAVDAKLQLAEIGRLAYADAAASRDVSPWISRSSEIVNDALALSASTRLLVEQFSNDILRSL